MKTILTRLKSTCGETLIESMVAILIFTFASILFLTLVTSAANINTTVKEADESFQRQQLAVEDRATETVPASVSLKKDGTELLAENAYPEFAVTKVDGDALYAYVLEGTS